MPTTASPIPTATPYKRMALVEIGRGMRRRFIIDLFLIPAVLITAAWLVTEAMDVYGQTSMIAIVFTTLGAPIVAVSVASLRVHLRSPRCPQCAARLVTASGRLQLSGDGCARCGRPIVSAGPETPPRLETHATFMARCDALARSSWRWTWISAGLLVVSGAGIYGLEEGWLPKSLEPPVFALGLGFMVTGLVARFKATPRAVRKAGLVCPTCNDPLVGGPGGTLTRHTMDTGTCPWCSAPVWS